MFPPRRHQKRLFDDAHGDNLYSPAGLVKHDLPRADERAFYMNLVMNGLTKEGYEFTGMTNDEIVMKRMVTK